MGNFYEVIREHGRLVKELDVFFKERSEDVVKFIEIVDKLYPFENCSWNDIVSFSVDKDDYFYGINAYYELYEDNGNVKLFDDTVTNRDDLVSMLNGYTELETRRVIKNKDVVDLLDIISSGNLKDYVMRSAQKILDERKCSQEQFTAFIDEINKSKDIKIYLEEQRSGIGKRLIDNMKAVMHKVDSASIAKFYKEDKNVRDMIKTAQQENRISVRSPQMSL